MQLKGVYVPSKDGHIFDKYIPSSIIDTSCFSFFQNYHVTPFLIKRMFKSREEKRLTKRDDNTEEEQESMSDNNIAQDDNDREEFEEISESIVVQSDKVNRLTF